MSKKNVAKQSATEASAVAAIAVAVGFAFSGAYIPAGVAALIGAGLFVLYEKYNIKGVKLSEEEVEQIAETSEEVVEETRDSIESR